MSGINIKNIERDLELSKTFLTRISEFHPTLIKEFFESIYEMYKHHFTEPLLAQDYETNRNFDIRYNKDGYVSYTSSHDEQRPFWKAKQFGDGAVKTSEATRLKRVPTMVALCAMLNGPQMFYMFDELGYDYSFCSNASGSGDQNDKAGYGSTQAQPCYGFFRFQ